MEVDEALSQLGTFGRWQVIYFTMLSTACMFPACWHMLAIVFIGTRRYFLMHVHARTHHARFHRTPRTTRILLFIYLFVYSVIATFIHSIWKIT